MIYEGDNATITCEKPANDTSEVYWVLTGSALLNETVIINDTQQSVLLMNGQTLDIQLIESTDVYEGNRSFSIFISNLTPNSSGLAVGCGAWSVENNTSSLYKLPAVIVVLPQLSPEIRKNYTIKLKYVRTIKV